jgi:hypothetical protein
MLCPEILEKVYECADPLFLMLDSSRPSANCVLKTWYHIFSQAPIIAEIVLPK